MLILRRTNDTWVKLIHKATGHSVRILNRSNNEIVVDAVPGLFEFQNPERTPTETNVQPESQLPTS